mmetsp:Transcript_64457/g.181359  ORF Transcript_64457/g.181359 Transcript_64457/m.181359 type:complete len:445 (+) Transcript_64457:84-1418(+)|eukprot:CAMPEP_0179219462 /NCGR_PEP_ID=MMETSP0797-20121207/5045_1 /TAXON_ID=47934 /ORGANISM="Dinophysis acuminata, Strain DAEP01" /LENGTH=444 /DNA_ID=CAMNT_0020925929 /DNA_START=83 /DNA_END=1417 /DNA_ORIENTATION=-
MRCFFATSVLFHNAVQALYFEGQPHRGASSNVSVGSNTTDGTNSTEHSANLTKLGPATSAVDSNGTSTELSSARSEMERMRELFGHSASAKVAACKSLFELLHMTHEDFTTMQPLEAQNAILESRADVHAIEAMKLYPNNVQVQLACADTLGSMALWNPAARATMGDHGAVEVIADALKRFPSDVAVQFKCSSLGSFADVDDVVGPANLVRVEETGVIRTVLQAFDDHIHNVTMAMSALSFLSGACLSSKMKQEMVGRGFPTKLVLVMRDYAGTLAPEEAVRGEALGVLSRCFMDAPMFDRMVHAGLIEAIVGTMVDATNGVFVDVMDNRRAQQNSMFILRKLANHKRSYRDAIVKAGAVNQIQAAINFTLAKPRGGCRTLAALLGPELPENCTRIIQEADAGLAHLYRIKAQFDKLNQTRQTALKPILVRDKGKFVKMVMGSQ